MKNKIFAAALVTLVALACAAILIPTRRNTTHAAGGAAAPQQVPEILATAPGLEIESREIETGADGAQRLKVKVKNRSPKHLVAWEIVISTVHGESAVGHAADPNRFLEGERTLTAEIDLRQIQPGATLSLRTAYDDGEVQGSPQGLDSFRKEVANRRGWAQ